MRGYFIILIISISMMSHTAAAGSLPLLNAAIKSGMVDINSSTNKQDQISSAIDSLKVLNPGIVDRMTYQWGGPTASFLQSVRSNVQHIHNLGRNPLFVGTLPEVIRLDYEASFESDGSSELYLGSQISSEHSEGVGVAWIDLSLPRAFDFYLSLGKWFIDNGVTILSFESSSSVVKYSKNKLEAETNFRRVVAALRSYGIIKDKILYFAGSAQSSGYIPIDISIQPSRLYHVDIPDYIKYQNKIQRPGVGVGYSYALSSRIILDARHSLPSDVPIFFGIDNWDGKQDDLTRLMELDPDNRRFLLLESAKAARSNGAYFSLPLLHCTGCVSPSVVGDKCELLADKSQSRYEAVRCDDVSTIAKAMRSEAG